MTTILRRLPFQDTADEILVGSDRVTIRPYQIVVWITLSLKSVLNLPPGVRRFPALLDTGHNHNLSLSRRHLMSWADLQPDSLVVRGSIREGSRRAPLYRLNAWLHPNHPGQRDQFAARPPFCLELPEGVAVYPDEAGFPPLPLLGLRALVRNKLHLVLDLERRCISLRSADWRTQVSRFLA